MERCQGCASTSPPQELVCSFLIYPPAGAQWGARPGWLWGGFPDPEKLICMGFAKNRLASSQQRKRAPRSLRGVGSLAGRRPQPGNHPVYQYCCSQAGRCSARSLLIYPPAGAQWSARPGGLRGGFPNAEYLNRIAFAKNGLASPRQRARPGGASAAWPSTRVARGSGAAGAGRRAPTPTGLPHTWASQPAYPIPSAQACRPASLPYTHGPAHQPAYPAPSPPGAPTLHLASRPPQV